MARSGQDLAESMADVIRKSVANTLTVMFNTPIEVCENASQAPSEADFIYCSEFVQDDARARILMLFSRPLIEKMVLSVFSTEGLNDEAAYQSTASEVVNIVGNCLKQYLNLHGYHFEMEIPYAFDPQNAKMDGIPLVQVAFIAANDSAMDVDFYLRSA